MISFYILFERFYLKPKWLTDARVASITKEECNFVVHFYIDYENLESQYQMND